MRMCRAVERRILSCLHDRKTRTKLHEIHAHFLRNGLNQSTQILSHFVSVCNSLGKIQYADLVFRQSHNPNILLYNAMIKGYSLSGPFDQSFCLFSEMRNCGIWPDEYTFAPLLKSCTNLCDLRLGQVVHGEVLVLGYDCCNSVGIGIVELYTKCEQMGEARKMFASMRQRDVIVWNLMIRGFCKVGDIETGFLLFRQMGERSIVTWNSMISCLAQGGWRSEALGLLRDMWDHGFEPDEATVVTVLPVCAHSGALEIGQWIHSYADFKGLSQNSINVGNSLVDFYCKSGNLDTGRRVFSEMPRKNVISWNAMISGLAFNGKGELGVALFEEMMKKGVEPTGSTFVGVLSCCAHAGLVKRGRKLFELMVAKHQIRPQLEHYGCMVDLLGRSGCVEEAYYLIKGMPMKPNAALWGALLSGCRTHGDSGLAECALRELIDLEPWNSGNYTLLSNIYAESGRWNEVEKIRVLMMERRVKKSPGQSMVR